MPRQVATEPPYCVVFHVSVAEPFLMAEVTVPILPGVLVVDLPAAVAEVPAAGDNVVVPAEEVSWVLSPYCGFVARFVVQFRNV